MKKVRDFIVFSMKPLSRQAKGWDLSLIHICRLFLYAAVRMGDNNGRILLLQVDSGGYVHVAAYLNTQPVIKGNLLYRNFFAGRKDFASILSIDAHYT